MEWESGLGPERRSAVESARHTAEEKLLTLSLAGANEREYSRGVILAAGATAVAAAAVSLAAVVWFRDGTTEWLSVALSGVAAAATGFLSAAAFSRRRRRHIHNVTVVPADRRVFTFERVGGEWRLRAVYDLDRLPAPLAELFARGEPMEGALAFDLDEYLRSVDQGAVRDEA